MGHPEAKSMKSNEEHNATADMAVDAAGVARIVIDNAMNIRSSHQRGLRDRGLRASPTSVSSPG
jgi:hypothetical protein